MTNRSRFHFDMLYEEYIKTIGNIVLYQVGDLSCEAGYDVGEHIQWCHEITYVVSGKGECFAAEVKYPIKKGDLQFSKKGERHNIISDLLDPIRFIYIGFDIINGKELTDILNYFCNMKNIIANDKYDVFSKFYSVFNELIDTHPYSDIVLKNAVENLLVYVYRNFNYDENKLYSGQDYKDSIVYDILYYIDCNARKIDKLSIIADEFGYTYSYISRIFKRVTGRTIKEYVYERQFKIASDLLLYSNMKITEIAEYLSYTSIHVFSRAFKNYTGMSPQEFKAKNAKDEV